MTIRDERDTKVLLEAGERLKSFRLSKKMIQSKFSEICGIARPTLSQVESGKIGITSLMIYNLIAYFPDFDPVYIITGRKKELETTPTEGG
jgi:transcriptional regulator with XRE-family HTH domain